MSGFCAERHSCMMPFGRKVCYKKHLMSDELSATTGTPSTVGRYRVNALLASDTIDDVYQGFDPLLERPVVVKLFRLGALDADAARRVTTHFYDVMRQTGALVDPGVMTLYDVGEVPGSLFVASEFVEGVSLASTLGEGDTLDLERKVSILSQIADALEGASAQGVAHLNLKPSSVLLGEDHSVKIGGFGVAAVTDAIAEASGLPRPALSRYAAPERAAGETGDARADVFSLAEIAVDLLAPKAVRDETPGAIPPLPPELGRQGVRVERWAAMFARALAPKPADRFASPAAFKAELLQVLGIDEMEARLAWDTFGASSLKSLAVDSEAETILAQERAPAPPKERQDDTRTKDDEDDPPTTFRKL
jgi:serine/threonine-protein kinase